MYFEVYDTDALLENFGCQTFISRVKVRNMIADSSNPNKLRNAYIILSTARKVTSQMRNQNQSLRDNHKSKKKQIHLQ